VRALEILEDEIRICLGLLGVTSLTELSSSYVTTAPAVSRPDTFSAFPLL
jgi:isopentenyl diphosphate isomerase/L-lactate dehydrogenase-like FMN-dependent dehydrogenase